MSDLEDFGRPGSQTNVSESYQLNPTSVIVSVVFSIIFLLGTIGNSLVLAVLLRSGHVGHHLFPGGMVVHFFINLTMYASSFTLAAVSVDRYLAIRYPLRSRELRTPCNAMVALVVIWGLSLVFAVLFVSPAGRSRTVRTIKYLWTAVDPLDGMSESKRAKRKVTKMIIIVTVLFCICWLPYHVVILCYLYGDFPFNQTTYAFRLLSHCMAYANSCVNPIVYALVSKHFRKGFKKVFSCILIKNGRNKVHVVHVANTGPGFEAGSTEVSHMNEENMRQNECEMINRPRRVEPREATVTLNLPFHQPT
uniref:G-protein coupled receptors family 1 profile domain-containing protein n=1 Tax=Nothobranchius korthausae TaxID=1143690 RepID=A0A1A8F9F9_9TELE